MKESKGYINSIETLGLLDGPGIRVVVFLQGCPLRCLYCHNPETWKLEGKTMTASEVVNKVKRFKPYFNNGGGVTFSGGEPLMQKKFLLECLKLCKEEGIHTVLDTSGAISDVSEVLNYTDLVILDIKAFEKYLYKKITSKDIEESLKFLDLCQKLNKRTWLRTVIVPGINDTEEMIYKYREFLRNLKNIEKVELLPYETLGVMKYEKLKIDYPLKGVKPMDKERCKYLNEILIKDLYE